MIYEYSGCGCNVVRQRVCPLAEYEADPTFRCPTCGDQLTQKISAPRVLLHTAQFEAFRSPVDGSIIASHSDLREHNKRNHVVNVHDGYDEAGVQNLTKIDYQKPLDEERRKDLDNDLRTAVQMLDNGYKPTPAQEGTDP